VCPRLFLDQLVATVSQRWLLREIIVLPEDSLGLTDGQVRFWLLALAAHAAPRSSACRWSSQTPYSAPGGQPVPAPAGHRS
jgi:hypothetical protein